MDVSAPASEETSHIIGIIASLLTSLDSDSPERIRLLTKFVERDYEKVDRLLDIREGVDVRLKAIEREIQDEKKVVMTGLLQNLALKKFLGNDARRRRCGARDGGPVVFAKAGWRAVHASDS